MQLSPCTDVLEGGKRHGERFPRQSLRQILTGQAETMQIDVSACIGVRFYVFLGKHRWIISDDALCLTEREHEEVVVQILLEILIHGNAFGLIDCTESGRRVLLEGVIIDIRPREKLVLEHLIADIRPRV